jgi:hypothetical protein
MDLEPGTDEQAQSAAHRKEVLRQLRQGVGGYPAFQGVLADLISPDEAEEARCAATRALRALRFAIAMLCLMLPFRLAFDTAVANAAVQVYFAFNLLAILILVGYFHIPYAGRMLVMNEALLTIVGDMTGAGLSRGNDYGYVPGGDPKALFGYVIFDLPIMFLIGWLFDFLASTEPGRRWPRMRRVLLAAVATLGTGIAIIGMYFARGQSTDARLGAVMIVLSGVVLILWAAFVIPCLEHRSRAISEDGLTVYHAAISRWMMHVLGKLLAIVVIAVTVFAWLRAIDSVEQMAPQGNRADYVRLTTRATGNGMATDTLLFWPRLARPMKTEDFQTPARRIYLLNAADVDLARQQLRAANRDFTFDDTTMIDALSYWMLAIRWDSRRVSSVDQFYEYVARPKARDLWVLEQLERRTLLADDKQSGAKFFYVVEPLSRRLVWYTERRLPAVWAEVLSWSIHIVTFGALAFLVLWRRGGDSRAARWTGLWLGGLAAWSLGVLQGDKLGNMEISSVALSAQDTTVGRFLLVLYAAFILISEVVVVLYVCFIPQWMLFSNFFGNPLLPRSVVRAHPRLAWYGTLLMLAMVGVCNYVLMLGFAELTTNQGMTMTGIVNIAAMCALWRRQRRQGRQERVVSRNAVLAFLSANVLMWLVSVPGRHAYTTYDIALNALMALLFIFWFARAVFHDDFLQLAGGRDVSFLASVIVLPILFETSEGSVQTILEGFGFFSETATGIVGTVAVVLLVQPVQHLLSTIFTHLINPGLSRVQKLIDQYTETVSEAEPQLGGDDPALQIFHGIGIVRFAFYACRRSGRLVESINNLDNDRPEIQISLPLRKKLSATKGFIDLDSAAFEWDYFYEQFELCRLQRQLDCRYLFPVCVGHSLRALLCLGDGATSRRIAREVYSEPINNLGIAKLGSSAASRPGS